MWKENVKPIQTDKKMFITADESYFSVVKNDSWQRLYFEEIPNAYDPITDCDFQELCAILYELDILGIDVYRIEKELLKQKLYGTKRRTFAQNLSRFFCCRPCFEFMRKVRRSQTND